MSAETPFLVAAYATTSGLDRASRRTLESETLANPAVDGFEVPFVDAEAYLDEIDSAVEAHAQAVVTLVSDTMTALDGDKEFGLASTSRDGRSNAVEHVRRAHDAMASLNRSRGRRAALAIEMHSAPRPWNGSSPAALADSLGEVAEWEWDGVELLLEHCDAGRPPSPFAKGFLTLEDEIGAISASGAPVGIVLNWGRSAIEGCSARHPLKHIRTARDAGLLRGFVYSGASDSDAARGGAWADFHLPPSSGEPDDPSLLTQRAIAEAERALEGADLLFRGLKVSLGPQASLRDRRSMLRQSISATA